MIIQEIVSINNKEYQRTYSDLNFYIERDGVKYFEAMDPEGYYDRVYTETDILCGTFEEIEEEEEAM